jgi:hypothetical protein
MTQDTTRREALFYVASAAGALVLGGVRGAYGQGEHTSSPTTMTDHAMKACIDKSEKCHRVCVETARYCLDKGGRHAAPEQIGLLIDCAEICQTTANFMLRGSSVHKTICGACAEICDRCAESCESIGDDTRLQECAKACRDCAESCRNLAKG